VLEGEDGLRRGARQPPALDDDRGQERREVLRADDAVGRKLLGVLEERLRRGSKSGYEFIFVESAGELVGYCAWGAVPLTKGSYDLYWIAVAPNTQGLGIGRRLMQLAELAIARLGGGRLYIETSSRAAYVRTRRFYRSAGYRLAARLRDFYARGDHKVVFCKTIAPGRRRANT